MIPWCSTVQADFSPLISCLLFMSCFFFYLFVKPLPVLCLQFPQKAAFPMQRFKDRVGNEPLTANDSIRSTSSLEFAGQCDMFVCSPSVCMKERKGKDVDEVWVANITSMLLIETSSSSSPLPPSADILQDLIPPCTQQCNMLFTPPLMCQ